MERRKFLTLAPAAIAVAALPNMAAAAPSLPGNLIDWNNHRSPNFMNRPGNHTTVRYRLSGDAGNYWRVRVFAGHYTTEQLQGMTQNPLIFGTADGSYVQVGNQLGAGPVFAHGNVDHDGHHRRLHVFGNRPSYDQPVGTTLVGRGRLPGSQWVRYRDANGHQLARVAWYSAALDMWRTRTLNLTTSQNDRDAWDIFNGGYELFRSGWSRVGITTGAGASGVSFAVNMVAGAAKGAGVAALSITGVAAIALAGLQIYLALDEFAAGAAQMDRVFSIPDWV